MNKITTLAFSLILSLGSLFSQKIDYDNSSKWYLGLNLGATWQTTDVANKTNVGWGLTLGKSFNYDYGKKLTFDLRARYLRGYWFGQDYDTTSLADYSGTALNTYKDSLGFSVNNFQADVHRLGFELVLHANGVRERTGWDPYIFGGVGFTWYQTFGDLYNNDSIGGIYNYEPENISSAYVNNLLDGIHDSPLDGSKKDEFTVGFMPSLGFGIGYQVGKRVTIGLEHKTTFTLVDNFDGFAATSKYNDIYHYTSAYINFRFRTNRPASTGGGNLNNVDNNNQNNLTGCVSPLVTFITPASNALVSSVMNYLVVAEIKDVIAKENLVFKQNGNSTLNFTYNTTTDRLESNVILTPGVNTFEISARNTCGSDVKTITVNYLNCLPPVISLVNPTTNGATVTNANFVLSAFVQNADNGQGIALNQNNMPVSTNSFNSATGSLQSNVNLKPGLNTFVLTSTNSCGTDSKTITVNYDDCVAPSIRMVSPSTNGTTVSNSAFNFSSIILNSNNGQGIVFKQNNRVITNFSFNNATSSFESNVTLNQGLNTFVITTTNSCGTDTETITINYQNCLAPNVSILIPESNGSTVSKDAFSISASIQNSNNGQGLTLTQNGHSVTNFNFNAGTGAFNSNLTLVAGVNTFVLSSTNACGTDAETITVNYKPCIAPIITVITPSTNGITVNNANFTLGVLVQNSNNGQGISLTHNRREITNFSFNSGTSSLQSAVTLSTGLNTFVVTSTNPCGTDTETITVNYVPCVLPIITLVNPAGTNTTVTTTSISFSATIANIGNTRGVTFTQNGITISNFTFKGNSFLGKINLNTGLNSFVLTATNDCGTVSETFTVNHEPCVLPVITVTSPASNGTTVSNANFSLGANIQNANSEKEVVVSQNGRRITNFTFNAGNGDFLSSVTLTPGLNTFVITSTNPCGTDTETITVNYENCVSPVITVLTPFSNGTTVSAPNYSITAKIQHVVNSQGTTLTQNGNNITNVNFNSSTGSLEKSVTLTPGLNTFVIKSSNSCGLDSKTITINFVRTVTNDITEEQKVTICHYPPGNTSNPQTIEIPLSAWPAHQAHGDKLGPCPVEEPVTPEEKITICHYPPGNIGNPQTIEIPLSAWPAHQAHGDKLGPCPVEEPVTPEEKITICHYPPGNIGNPQTIEIPLSAWPAHQAHGDKLGPCPVEEPVTPEEKITICHYPPGNIGNPQTIEIPLSAWPAHQAHGDKLGPCPVEEPVTPEEKITICHYPPGNIGNPQTIEIPLSAWPAHEAHGDKLGPCPAEEDNTSGSNTGETGTGLTIGEGQKITICHYPPGNIGNPQTIEIPLSAWPAHQAHGDKLGPCPIENNNGSNNGNNGGPNGNTGGSNGNNGHGNNGDGIDSSNPGQGSGGPNGGNDGSDDDEDGNNGGKSKIGNTGSSGNSSNSTDAAQKAVEEAKRKADEAARVKAEQEVKKAADEAKRKADETEAKRKADEVARVKAEQEAKKAADEAKRKADETEAKRKADEVARVKAEQEAKKAADEAKRKADEAEAKRKADEAARVKAEQDAKKAADEAKRKADETEAKRKADEAADLKAKQDAKKTADEAKKKAEEEKNKADEEKEKNKEIKPSGESPKTIGGRGGK